MLALVRERERRLRRRLERAHAALASRRGDPSRPQADPARGEAGRVRPRRRPLRRVRVGLRAPIRPPHPARPRRRQRRGQPPAALRRLQPPQGSGARVKVVPGRRATRGNRLRRNEDSSGSPPCPRGARRRARPASSRCSRPVHPPRVRPAATATRASATATSTRWCCPPPTTPCRPRRSGWHIPNQQVGIPDQLAQGVRGFLIDTYYAHREPTARSSPTRRPRLRQPLPLPRGLPDRRHAADRCAACDALVPEQAPEERARHRERGLREPGGLRREFKRAGLRRHVWRGRTGRAGRRCAR